MRATLRETGGIAIALAISAPGTCAALQSERSFKIPAQRLDTALLAYSRQSGIQIVADAALLAARTAPRLEGLFTPEAALRKLLGGSGLGFSTTAADVVAIGPASPVRPPADRHRRTVGQDLIARPSAPDDEADILVTGTSIRGEKPIGSTLIAIGAPVIQHAGSANTAELLSTIPQLNSFNIVPESQALRSRTQGYALNVHHLGYYATLTLVNGHRYAPSGGEVTFVDPGMIPTIAIDRVEILPDGASAIYGSDAVAGVVNLVYRQTIDGIEASVQNSWGRGSLRSLQVGAVAGRRWADGSILLAAEFSRRTPPTVGQLHLKGDNRDRPGGRDQRSTNCSPGNVTADGVTYGLPAYLPQRNLCEASPDQELYPRGSRTTALLVAKHRANDHLDLYADGSYGHYRSVQRQGYTTIAVTVPDTNPFFQSPPDGATAVQLVRNSNGLFANRVTAGYEEEMGATVGVDDRFAEGWLAKGFIHASQDRNYTKPFSIDPVKAQLASGAATPETALNPYAGASGTNPAVLAFIDDGYYTRNRARNRLLEVSAKIDGPIRTIPGGPVKAAVGLEYRYEDVRQLQDYGAVDFHSVVRDTLRTRNVFSAYGELAIPLRAKRDGTGLIRGVELTASARHDRYDGLRSITNPRVGVTLGMGEELTIRGSWSTSFVAPNLGALGGTYLIPFYQQNQTAIGLGVINLIHIAGGNQNLKPEYATTWSAGARYRPAWLAGADLDLSYFHVIYRNTQYQPQEGLSDPAVAQFLRAAYPPGVILDVTPADVDALLARYRFQGLYPPGTVWSAITTSALVNAGDLHVQGLDFTASYSTTTGLGELAFSISGTHMTKYRFQLLPSLPSLSQLDTQRAPRWTWQSTAAWSNSRFSTELFWNHTASYQNFTVLPHEQVKQFNTVDLRISARFFRNRSFEASLRIQNLLSSNAPYYASLLGYDAASASPLGRVWQLSGRVRY